MPKSKLPHKKTLWRNPKIEHTPDYVEARESILGESIAALLLIVGPAVGFAIFLIESWPWRDVFVQVAIGVVCGLIMVGGLILYRPPRFVRLYPFERVAHTGRRVLGVAVFSRWTDLGAYPPEVLQSYVMTKVDNEGAGAAVMGCLAVLLGPLGVVFALISMANRREVRHRCYELYPDARADPQQRPRLLGRFATRHAAERLLAMYDATRSGVHTIVD